MTIFNTSKDPIFLKKIPLRIWKLRDEIESVIQSRYEKGSKDEKSINVEELTKEYSPKQSTSYKGEIESNKSIPIIPSEKTAIGKAIISEINMDGISCFCNQSFLIGNAIVVEFQVPNHFVINAVVLNNKIYDLKSKIISEHKLPYRINLKWTFLKSGERTLLRNFLESLNPLIVEKDKFVAEEIKNETSATEEEKPIHEEEEKKSA